MSNKNSEPKASLVQAFNPRSKEYVLIDRDVGKLVGHSKEPFPEVEIVGTVKTVE